MILSQETSLAKRQGGKAMLLTKKNSSKIAKCHDVRLGVVVAVQQNMRFGPVFVGDCRYILTNQNLYVLI